MDRTEISDRMNRRNILITFFLAMVAFMFVISEKLPKVDFLTVLDEYILGSFAILFCTSIEIFVVFVVKGDLAHKFDWYGRIYAPAIQLSVTAFCFLKGILGRQLGWGTTDGKRSRMT